MIDGPFRRILPKFTGGLIRFCTLLGLTPNMISLAGLVLASMATLLCLQGNPGAAITLWWFSRLLDGTDGIYARATGRASDFGAYLDIVCDMAANTLMVLGFMGAFPALQWEWSLTLSLYIMCITSALALGALEEKRQLTKNDNRGLRLASGLAEAGETGIAYTVFLLFPDSLPTLVRVWIALLGVTVISRTLLARSILSGKASIRVVEEAA